MTPTKAKAAPAEKKPVLVTRSIVVDNKSTVRRIVEATPSTCLECGFNVMQGEDIPDWDDLMPEEQAAAMAALRRHIKKLHPLGNNRSAVIEEKDIVRKWMHKPLPV